MRATFLFACAWTMVSCSDVCGSDEPAAAERLLQFPGEDFFDGSAGVGATAIRDEATFRALWEHHAVTYDMGTVPEVDFATSQVVIVQWRCNGCNADAVACTAVESVTLVDGAAVFSVPHCGEGSDCDYSIFPSEVWRTDITPVELCTYARCSK